MYCHFGVMATEKYFMSPKLEMKICGMPRTTRYLFWVVIGILLGSADSAKKQEVILSKYAVHSISLQTFLYRHLKFS